MTTNETKHAPDARCLCGHYGDQHRVDINTRYGNALCWAPVGNTFCRCFDFINADTARPGQRVIIMTNGDANLIAAAPTLLAAAEAALYLVNQSAPGFSTTVYTREMLRAAIAATKQALPDGP